MSTLRNGARCFASRAEIHPITRDATDRGASVVAASRERARNARVSAKYHSAAVAVRLMVVAAPGIPATRSGPPPLLSLASTSATTSA